MRERVQGTVLKIASVSCQVDVDGELYECLARGRLKESDTKESKPLAVGDRVEVGPTGPNRGVIESVAPRRTKLSRAHPNDPKIEKVIVANVDQVLVVGSVRRPALNVGIIDRCLIAAQSGGLDGVVCINKCDLARESSEYEEVAECYRRPGLKVLITSARTGVGMDGLKTVLQGKSTVLAGHSGVGKSSLLNAIQPGLRLKTGLVKDAHKGRHVTSSVSLLRLDFGGYVADTPGIREFNLWDTGRREITWFFPEISELLPQCKMSNCIHVHEPGCAVKEAVERGSVARLRYESYLRIVDSIAESSQPRDTDVERPQEQIARRKREPSRRKRKQDIRRQMDEELQ